MHEIRKTIGELIEGREVPTFRSTDPVSSAITAMRATAAGGVVVLDQDEVAGIFTERDLLYRVAAEGRDPAQTPLAAVMTRNPETLERTACVSYAINRMALRGFSNIPITDGGRVVELLGIRDVMAHLTEVFAELEEPGTEADGDWVDIGGG